MKTFSSAPGAYLLAETEENAPLFEAMCNEQTGRGTV
jgi:hypothetical protein